MKNHILIIDDDEMIRTDIAQFLRNEGYEVSAAGTGQEGLSILGKEKIDLILLDLNLPDGDGLSIEQHIREEFSVPIIIVTARTGQDDKLMALGLGATGYLTKPVDEKELSLRVRNIIGLVSNGTEAASPPQKANTLEIEKALSQQVQDFIDRTRTGPGAKAGYFGGRRWSGGLVRGLAIIAVIAVGGGSAVWYFDKTTELSMEPVQTRSGPEESSGAPVDTTIERPDAGPPVQKTLEKKKPVVSVDIPVEQPPKKPTAGKTGYEWALNSKCDPIPVVKWWKYKTHESIAAYVDQKLDGDWKTYMNQWYRRLLNLQEIYGRNSGARTTTGVVLRGDALKAYIEQMRIRLSIIRCLAKEAKEFASGQ